MITDFVIETHGLSKRYGKRMAVEELSIEVPVGVVAGFVGPNGAGKTTTMSMLLGLISPTGGDASVLGEPLDRKSAYLPQIGALIERPAFYPGLSGEENLRLLATVGGHDPSRVPELLALVGLAERGGDRFGAYSMGMKQRLGIAAALLGDPALLILDEPTNGLDPAGIHEMRQLIRQLADEGRTIFVSSHILAELEQVCDWFVIIDRGSLVFQGSKSQLLDGAEASLVVAPERDEDLSRLEQLITGKGHAVQSGLGVVVVDIGDAEPRRLAADVSRSAAEAGLVLVELRLERMNLEERYLSMANGGKP
jgi:ABC-2 type transport system ATP-binding protein